MFRKHGKWTFERRDRIVGILDGLLCSECGEWHAGHTEYPFCPYCGAVMDGEPNEPGYTDWVLIDTGVFPADYGPVWVYDNYRALIDAEYFCIEPDSGPDFYEWCDCTDEWELVNHVVAWRYKEIPETMSLGRALDG